jgi:hypothetical protein
MVGESHDNRNVQRGITEALACQDMLESVPLKPSWMSHVVDWIVGGARSIAQRRPDPKPEVASAAPHST